MSRTIIGAALAALAIFTMTPACAARAEVFPSESAPSRVIFVPRDKSLSFRLDAPASKIVVAQPDTAEIVATTDHSFYVRGKEVGSTNLLVYGPGGRLSEVIDVRVGYDAAALQDDLAQALPGEDIHVRTLGGGLLLTGTATTTSAANRARMIAETYAPNAVTSQVVAASSQQVVLEVRVIEATRQAMHDLGVSVDAHNIHGGLVTAGGLVGNSTAFGALTLLGDPDVQLQTLEEKGVVRTLARPNLVAVSGEKASFLAGGEFPYPVPNGLNTIVIEFRPYGVKLDFQPTVEDNGLIRLQVAPEVSALDPTNSLRVAAITVPALTVRRASTTVELKDGTSFAIGGLLQHTYSDTVRQFPGLGNLPVLGALLRSTQWQRSETELLIIVTVRMATPADFAVQPTVSGEEPSAIDLILNGHALDKPLPRETAAKPIL